MYVYGACLFLCLLCRLYVCVRGLMDVVFLFVL